MQKAAGIILINNKKEILLQLRDNIPNIAFPGYWGLFGGSLEKDETPEEGIIREIKEELNLKLEKNKIEKIMNITIRRNFDTEYFENVKEDIDCTIFLYNLTMPLNELKLQEGQDMKFFKKEEIKNLKTTKFVKEIIKSI